MKKRLNGKWIVALILILSAALSINSACPRALPLVIMSERVILETGSENRALRGWSISMDGRQVLFEREDAKGEGVLWLLNIGTGEQLHLPFPSAVAREWGSVGFISDGTYIYAAENRKDNSRQEAVRPNDLFVYDIRNRVLRKINMGLPCRVVGEEGGNLIVAVDDIIPSKCRVAIVPIGDGKVKWYAVQGYAWRMSRSEHTFFKSIDRKELSIVDLVRGKTLKRLSVSKGLGLDDAFYTTDDRFVCYNYRYEERKLDVMMRNWIAKVLPFVGPSNDDEWRTVSCSCFWDSVTDHVATLHDSAALNAGPTPSSVWRAAGSESLRLLDLASGREFVFPKPLDIDWIDFANKYVIYKVKDPDDGEKIVLVEVALPGKERRR